MHSGVIELVNGNAMMLTYVVYVRNEQMFTLYLSEKNCFSPSCEYAA